MKEEDLKLLEEAHDIILYGFLETEGIARTEQDGLREKADWLDHRDDVRKRLIRLIYRLTEEHAIKKP